MTPATRTLHASLIRLAKGAVTAWESWLDAQQPSLTSTGSQPRLANKPRALEASRFSGEAQAWPRP